MAAIKLCCLAAALLPAALAVSFQPLQKASRPAQPLARMSERQAARMNEREPPPSSWPANAPSLRDDTRAGQAVRGTRRRGPRKPRATLSRTDAGSLLITQPAQLNPEGLQEVLFGGVFAAIWTSVFGRAFVRALASRSYATAALELLFLAVGAGGAAQDLIVKPLAHHELCIGAYAYSARCVLAGRVYSDESGPTADLHLAAPLSREAEPADALALWTRGGKQFAFGSGLSADEVLFLSDEVNAFLAGAEARAAQLSSEPPPMRP